MRIKHPRQLVLECFEDNDYYALDELGVADLTGLDEGTARYWLAKLDHEGRLNKFGEERWTQDVVPF